MDVFSCLQVTYSGVTVSITISRVKSVAQLLVSDIMSQLQKVLQVPRTVMLCIVGMLHCISFLHITAATSGSPACPVEMKGFSI